MAPQFTESVAQVLTQAVSEAEKRRHTEVTEHHVLHAFFQDRAGYFQTLAAALQLDPHPLIAQLENKLASLPTYSRQAQQPSLSRGLQSQVNHAHVLAQKWKDTYISSDHFFYVFWETACDPFKSWREASKISLKQVEEKIQEIRGGRHMDSPSGEASLQALEKFCKNLTDLAKQGKLDPVIGRDEEIRRTIQVLSRRTKNNPLLIGEPGVCEELR